jgi:hypothetical protein
MENQSQLPPDKNLSISLGLPLYITILLSSAFSHYFLTPHLPTHSGGISLLLLSFDPMFQGITNLWWGYFAVPPLYLCCFVLFVPLYSTTILIMSVSPQSSLSKVSLVKSLGGVFQNWERPLATSKLCQCITIIFCGGRKWVTIWFYQPYKSPRLVNVCILVNKD